MFVAVICGPRFELVLVDMVVVVVVVVTGMLLGVGADIDGCDVKSGGGGANVDGGG